jgi:hypothetical protein
LRRAGLLRRGAREAALGLALLAAGAPAFSRHPPPRPAAPAATPSAAPAASAPAAQERTLERVIDPIGNFVPIKPKVFKDLDYIEITDYDRVKARNTGQPYAVVHMEKGNSALEPGRFRLIGLALEFEARSENGIVYRFRGRFTRAGDLYAKGESDEPVLRGHLATYMNKELLRQENLQFEYRTGDEDDAEEEDRNRY